MTFGPAIRRNTRKPVARGEADAIAARIREKMQRWGITLTLLASHLGVSRQYAWQIAHQHASLSLARACEIELAIDCIISRTTHLKTFGERLRAARISAGLTLKQVAELIGYSWVGVERWEKNICLPKPGVLWHLFSLYGVTSNQARDLSIMSGVNPHRETPLSSGQLHWHHGAHEELALALLASLGYSGMTGIGLQPGRADALQLVTGQRKRAKSTAKE